MEKWSETGLAALKGASKGAALGGAASIVSGFAIVSTPVTTTAWFGLVTATAVGTGIAAPVVGGFAVGGAAVWGSVAAYRVYRKRSRLEALLRSADLPTDKEAVQILKPLAELSEKVAETQRESFLRDCGTRILAIPSEYRNTIALGAISWAIGEIVENMTTLPFGEISLLGDEFSELAGVAGAGWGLLSDGRREELAKQIIVEELRAAKQREACTLAQT